MLRASSGSVAASLKVREAARAPELKHFSAVALGLRGIWLNRTGGVQELSWTEAVPCMTARCGSTTITNSRSCAWFDRGVPQGVPVIGNLADLQNLVDDLRQIYGPRPRHSVSPLGIPKRRSGRR